MKARHRRVATAWRGGLLSAWVLGLVACAGGGSGGGGASGAAGAQGTVPGAGGQSASQWQVAMAALAGRPSPDPVRVEAASIASWNAVLARAWPRLLAAAQPILDRQLRSRLTAQSSAALLRVLTIRRLDLDLAAAPGFSVTAPANQQTLSLQLPASPRRWSLRTLADVGGMVPVSVFGQTTQIAISAPVEIRIDDLSVEVPLRLDLADPQRPVAAGAGTPQLRFRLSVQSQDPIAQRVLGPLTQALDPIVRAALLVATGILQQQVDRAIRGLGSSSSWGQGGPAIQTVQGASSLEALAVQISDQIQRDHMPHDQVWPAIFDQPQGGQVVHYKDHGDSAFWTGHYLAAESYRFDLTGDPRALAGAARALGGIRTLVNVWRSGDGLLSRSAIPVTSPWFKDIQANGGLFLRRYGGESYGALGHVSRDQYLGVFLGLGQVLVRVPALRGEAVQLIGQMLGYLEAHDWVIYLPDGVTISTTFATTPGAVGVLSTIGGVADPRRWGAMQARYRPLAELAWLPAWVSAQEVHVSYYKFNLQHALLTIAFELETDPQVYRAYLRALRIDRAAIGHHQNGWFDAVYGMAVPTKAQVAGALVQRELEHWALRPRRGFSARGSRDPSIQKAWVTVTWTDFNQQTQSAQSVTRRRQVATHPVPIEKRPPTDYLWQRSPFELDGGIDPRDREPGIDLLLPYWSGRSHGLLR